MVAVWSQKRFKANGIDAGFACIEPPHRCKRQCEATAGPGAGNLSKMGAVSATIDFCNPGGQISFRLKEIQMPPFYFDRVVGLEAHLTTVRACERAAFGKIEVNL